MTSDPRRDLLNELDWGVLWSSGGVLEQTKKVAKKVVTQAWESGTLPIKLEGKRQWIVVYKIHKTFFGQTATPILTGPKKPRLLRERYYTDIKVERGV